MTYPAFLLFRGRKNHSSEDPRPQPQDRERCRVRSVILQPGALSCRPEKKGGRTMKIVTVSREIKALIPAVAEYVKLWFEQA